MLYKAKDKWKIRGIHGTTITLTLYCWQQPECCVRLVLFVCYQSHLIFGIHLRNISRDV